RRALSFRYARKAIFTIPSVEIAQLASPELPLKFAADAIDYRRRGRVQLGFALQIDADRARCADDGVLRFDDVAELPLRKDREEHFRRRALAPGNEASMRWGRLRAPDPVQSARGDRVG